MVFNWIAIKFYTTQLENGIYSKLDLNLPIRLCLPSHSTSPAGFLPHVLCFPTDTSLFSLQLHHSMPCPVRPYFTSPLEIFSYVSNFSQLSFFLYFNIDTPYNALSFYLPFLHFWITDSLGIEKNNGVVEPARCDDKHVILMPFSFVMLEHGF